MGKIKGSKAGSRSSSRSNESSGKKKNSNREYLQKCNNRLNKVASPNRIRRSQEKLWKETTKISPYISLTDEIFEYVDHTHLRSAENVTTGNVYTPEEPSNYASPSKIYLTDNFEMRFLETNNSQKIPQTIETRNYEPLETNEDEYNETMDEITSESIGVPVCHPKAGDHFSVFRTKPIFPNQIIPWSSKFTDSSDEIDVIYEEIEVDTKDLEFLKEESSIRMNDTHQNEQENQIK